MIENQLTDGDLIDAVTLAGRHMLRDVSEDLRQKYLLRVLEDKKDARDAAQFLKRERDRLTRWA